MTLLSDAAHLMSPFAGEGVNLALYDGVELAKALVEHPDDVEATLAAYETALFLRSSPIARASADNLQQFFAEGARAAWWNSSRDGAHGQACEAFCTDSPMAR